MSVIGITAVTSKAAAMSYLHIVETALKKEWKHPEIIIHSPSVDLCLQAIQQAMKNQPKHLIKLLLYSLSKLSASGATLAIIPNNSAHLVIQELQKESPIKCISIIEPIVEKCKSERFQKICIIGPSSVIHSKMYETPLLKEGIGTVAPNPKDQKILQDIIFSASMKGSMSKKQKEAVKELFNKIKNTACFDALVISCSELTDVITPEFTQIPTINPFKLQSEAVLQDAARH